MPVTRSTSRQPAPPQPNFQQSHTQHKKKPGATFAPDESAVIILSSDEEDQGTRSIQRSPSKRQRAKAKARTPGAAFVPIGEIVEVSSDDDGRRGSTSSSCSTLSKLQRQLLTLQAENTRLRKENVHLNDNVLQVSKDYRMAADEVLELKAVKRSAGKGKLVLDADRVEEHVTCEICTLKMWIPCLLPDCGHVFCQSCLEDWFSTALAQHMAAHPDYNPNAPIPGHLRNVLQNVDRFPVHYQVQVQAQLAQLRPKYTCPSCRQDVRNRPAEDFPLKAVVRTVAEALGETSPQKELPRKGVPRANIWDGFFPKNLT